MREMHKWKDKVELSLDNRQIFFLFFGLSVVGCFVFALGLMVGRRVDLDGEGASGLSAASLALLDGEGEDEAALSFKDGLRAPPPELPQTRDPNSVGAPPAEETAHVEPQAEPPAAVPTGSEGAAKSAKSGKSGKSAKKAARSKRTLLAAAAKPRKGKKQAGAVGGRRFTLQMKAFNKRADADTFAAKLQARGHAARVESDEVKGRLWHRVRVGTFETWAEGLAAKDGFEKSERTIAYVVRK